MDSSTPLEDFHTKIENILKQIEKYNFCEGIHVQEAVDGAKHKTWDDVCVDNSVFCTKKGIINSTIRSPLCTMYYVHKEKTQTQRCEHCYKLYRSSLRYRIQKLTKKDEKEHIEKKMMADSKCPLATLSHDMLLTRARSLASALHAEKVKNSYWYRNYIQAKKEMKCKMPKSFSEHMTADNMKKLITEATKKGELNENSVVYYIMHDVLKTPTS